MYKKILILALLVICNLCNYINQVVAITDDYNDGSFYQLSVNEILNDLLKIRIENYHLYQQTFKKIKDKELRSLLTSLANNNEEQINILSKLIIENNGVPIVFNKSEVTPYKKTINASKSKLKILEAIEVEEIINNRAYRQALSATMPREIKLWLQNKIDDNEHLLESIKHMQDKLKAKHNEL